VAVVLTVTAPGPAALAELWARLGGHHAHVDIVGDDISIHVDLTPPQPEPDQADDHDGHTVDVGEVEVSEPAAEVVAIDRKARQQHPTGTTLAAQILDLFHSEPATEFTPSDVLDHLDATYGGISGTIATLVRNGKIQRVGRGQYKGQSLPVTKKELEMYTNPEPWSTVDALMFWAIIAMIIGLILYIRAVLLRRGQR